MTNDERPMTNDERPIFYPLLFVFPLVERKNEQQKEEKVPCCRRRKLPFVYVLK
jgi:hypothetical protein